MGNSQAQIKEKNQDFIGILQQIEDDIFKMNENNIPETVESTLYFITQQYPYSFKLVICQLLYSYFVMENENVQLIFEYIKLFKIKEEELYNQKKDTNNETKEDNIINIFTDFLYNYNTQESNYILERLMENKIIENKKIRSINSLLFIHYKRKKEIKNIKSQFLQSTLDNYKALSKNDFELHKQLLTEGHNPNEIAKIIRNDDIEKLQEISSQTNFNFNQTIEPSLYERCSFINEDNVTLIDYAAFFSSVKCFKYLLINNAKVENTGKYAVASGNEEIIHLCEQNHSSFDKAYETAILFHRNDIFKYIYENKLGNIMYNDLLTKCVFYYNYEILSFLINKDNKNLEELISTSIKTGNIFFFKYFVKNNTYKIPKNVLSLILIPRNKELLKYILINKFILIKSNDDDSLVYI